VRATIIVGSIEGIARQIPKIVANDPDLLEALKRLHEIDERRAVEILSKHVAPSVVASIVEGEEDLVRQMIEDDLPPTARLRIDTSGGVLKAVIEDDRDPAHTFERLKDRKIVADIAFSVLDAAVAGTVATVIEEVLRREEDARRLAPL